MNDRPKYRTTNFKIYSQNITNINVDEDTMTISTIFCEYSYQTSLRGLLPIKIVYGIFQPTFSH